MKQNNDALEALDEVAKVIAYASYYDDDVDEHCKLIHRELEQAQKMREELYNIKEWIENLPKGIGRGALSPHYQRIKHILEENNDR